MVAFPILSQSFAVIPFIPSKIPFSSLFSILEERMQCKFGTCACVSFHFRHGNKYILNLYGYQESDFGL